MILLRSESEIKLVNLKPINRPGSIFPLHFGQIGIGEGFFSFIFLPYTILQDRLPNGLRLRSVLWVPADGRSKINLY